MRFFLLFLISLSCFAAPEFIQIQNANLDYTSPMGQGDLEKLRIGASFSEKRDAITIEKTVDGQLVLRHPVVEFTWGKPWSFLVDLETLNVRQTSLSAGLGDHSVVSEQIKFRQAAGKEATLTKVEARCELGFKDPDLVVRLMEDCREKMLLKIDVADLPMDSAFLTMLKNLPQVPDNLERPVQDVYATSNKGDLYIYFLARYYVKAGLRTWAHLSYENDRKLAVIKVDRIKFGILSVTSLVMNELKKAIKDPRVEVDPPYIRIKLQE